LKKSAVLASRIESLRNHPHLPAHIGVIMDGNGRWAKKRGLPRIAGHRAGIDSVRQVVELCGEIGIKVLTLFTFSRENWKRPPVEVSALMKLLVTTIHREMNELMQKNVKIISIGCLADLPAATRESLRDAIKKSAGNTGLTLNLALSYGSRSEIRDAVIKIARKVKEKTIEPEDIDDAVIAGHLQTAELPDPDLIIRTSGEFRISNFLLWQIAYAEIYVADTLWPDFGKEEMIKAIQDYLCRERRFGMVTEQLKSRKTIS
jgi:undecaprenyl diphosphate synthase